MRPEMDRAAASTPDWRRCSWIEFAEGPGRPISRSSSAPNRLTIPPSLLARADQVIE
jgi:hypothetical protein